MLKLPLLQIDERSNLSGSKPSNVESEQKDPEIIPLPKTILKKVSLVDERKLKREKVKEELANLQFQMKSLKREKFEVEKEFISSQRRVRNNTLVTSVPQASVNYTIHEALQMRHSKQQQSQKTESQ